MRTVVALLEARPETILDDYQRLLALAQLETDTGRPPRLVAPAGRGAWQPGVVAPPWQLAGLLAGATPGGVVFPVAADGGAGTAAPGLWDDVLRGGDAHFAGAGDWRSRQLRPTVPVPALDAALPEGPHLPAGLAAGGAVLLPVPEVGRGWPVAGAVALLVRLLAPRRGRRGRRDLAEIAAEVVALARESLALRGAVLDGTVWHVHAGPLARWPVGRNVILAGRDPVAVDAVASRLAGADPRRVPWLRLCGDRGLGEHHPDRIRVVGQERLLDLDFAMPPHTLVAGARLPGRRPWADLAYNLIRRTAVARGHRDTPWGRLCGDFRNGQKAPS